MINQVRSLWVMTLLHSIQDIESCIASSVQFVVTPKITDKFESVSQICGLGIQFFTVYGSVREFLALNKQHLYFDTKL